jgi:hypothetical protein
VPRFHAFSAADNMAVQGALGAGGVSREGECLGLVAGQAPAETKFRRVLTVSVSRRSLPRMYRGHAKAPFLVRGGNASAGNRGPCVSRAVTQLTWT